MKKRTFISLFWLLLPFAVLGKIVTGKIVDTENGPIAFANVVLMCDTTFLSGSITDDSGLFTISDNGAANKIRISKTGYEDISLPLNQSTDIGTIVIKQVSLMLDEVIVEGNLPITQLKGNTIVTKVQNSLLSKMGNAYDVLTHTPMVTGINGELNVIGRGIPTVYINGREVCNPSDLQQLKSEDIQSIELITNPGAAYSSEINSVIRIRTLSPKGDGFGLDITEKLTMWSYVRNTLDINLRYRHNGLEIFGDIDLYDGKRKYDDLNEMTTFSKDTFFQSLWNTSVLTTHSIFGKLGFSYTLSPHHSFGAYFRLGQSKSKNEGHLDSESNIFKDNTVSQLEKISSTYNNSSRYYPSQEANAYYNGNFGKLSIDFNADYLQGRNTTNENRQDFSIESDLNNRTVESDGLTKNRMIAEKLIVSYPIWKGGLEIGEEYTGSKLSYNYFYEGAPIENSSTDISENNLAAFAKLSQAFGKWNISIGLRYEHANFLYSNEHYPERSISRKYSNIFPSVSASTKIGNVRLSLDFTNKMKRPSYRKLDGGVNYVNRYVYQGGNPLLKPSKIYNLQAMGMLRNFYAVMMYNHELDAVFNTTRNYGEDPLIKIMTFINEPHYQYLQCLLGARLAFGCWQPNPEIGLFKQFCKINYRGVPTSFNKPIYSFTLDNVFSLPNDWQIGADIWLYSAANSQNCFIKSTQQLSFSIRKSFFNENLVLQLKATDLLDRASNKVTIYSGDIKNYMYNHHEPRNVTLSVRYSFNKSKSKYKGTGAGKDEKKRM